MSHDFILPDAPVPNYRMRLKRDARSKGVGSAASRRFTKKRFGILAAIVAVPAIATSSNFGGDEQSALNSSDHVEPMGFEIPGESFPGSAFYYLEDIPEVQAETTGFFGTSFSPSSETDEAAPSDGLASTRDFAGSPPAPARALRISGSDTDYSRAQRCMTQAIYYEAASESDAGQRAVAQVILNRVAHSTYPNTVCGVVFQGSERQTGCQFSFTCDGAMTRRPSASLWTRAGRISRQSLAGTVYAPVGTATHYHTLAVNPHWAPSLDPVTVIGAHIFYRWKGRAGLPAAFGRSYRGGEPRPGVMGPAAARTPIAASPTDSVISPFALPEAPAAPTGVPQTGSGSYIGELANMPAASANTLPSPEQESSNDMLPSSGGVREEYSRSGQWKEGSPGN